MRVAESFRGERSAEVLGDILKLAERYGLDLAVGQSVFVSRLVCRFKSGELVQLADRGDGFDVCIVLVIFHYRHLFPINNSHK